MSNQQRHTNSPEIDCDDVKWWSEDAEEIEFRFRDPYQISLHIWLLYGDSSRVIDPVANPPQTFANVGLGADVEALIRAIYAVIDTAYIWLNEKQGFEFKEIVCHNLINGNNQFCTSEVSPNTDVDPFLLFGLGNCKRRPGNRTEGNYFPKAIREEIGFSEGSINVYFVKSVEGSISNGYRCRDWGSGAHGDKDKVVIVMGSQTKNHLLAHELGHAFDLGHVNNQPSEWEADFLTMKSGEELTQDVLTQNVMHGETWARKYFTEGQTFRAATQPLSAIARVYDTGQKLHPMKDCSNATKVLDLGSLEKRKGCPLIQTRLWADGLSSGSSESE